MKQPDLVPDFAPLLMAKMQALAIQEGPLERAHPDALIRHSDAGSCSRQIYYSAIDEPETDPLDGPNYYTFEIGHILHREFQDALRQYCDAKEWECEIEKQVYLPECSSAGHLDAHITTPDEKITLEIKTINGTGYKYAIAVTGDNPKPRDSAVVQGAINAYAAKADRLVVIYLPLEVVSTSVAQRNGIPTEMRACAQWSYTREEFLPLAEAEMARFRWIAESARRQSPVPRYIPDPDLPPKSVVIDPNKGVTEGEGGVKGQTWQCDYCRFRVKCLSDLVG